MLIWDLEIGIAAQPLAPLDVRVDGAALNRAGPHERDLDSQVVEARRLRAAQALHLGAALDLEHAGRLGALDCPVHLLVVVGSAREINPLAAHAPDLLDAALD